MPSFGGFSVYFPPASKLSPPGTFPPLPFSSLFVFFLSLSAFFFCHFFPLFCLFLTPKLRKKAENCESFAAFHTCSTQNAEFVNRHNSSGKTKQANAARPRQYSPPPQKRRFLAQNHVASDTCANPKPSSFFFKNHQRSFFVIFFTNPPPFVHRDTTETLQFKSHPEISIKKFPKHPKIAIFVCFFSAVTSKQTISFSFFLFFAFLNPGHVPPP